MTNQHIEELQRAVLSEIVNILNRQKGIPVSMTEQTVEWALEIHSQSPRFQWNPALFAPIQY